MAEISGETKAIVDAIMDLTRVTIALNGQFKNKSDAVRCLGALDIPPVRIAVLLGVPAPDVRSALAKERKRVSRTADVVIENTKAAEGGVSDG